MDGRKYFCVFLQKVVVFFSGMIIIRITEVLTLLFGVTASPLRQVKAVPRSPVAYVLCEACGE